MFSYIKWLVFGVAVLIPFTYVSCDDDSKAVCGNGIVEKGEECDDGNLQDGDGCTRFCLLPAYKGSTVVVRWYINGTQTISGQSYSYDTCSDVGASKTRIKIFGPNGLVGEDTVQCSSMEYRLTDNEDSQFPDGSYHAEIAFLDSGDATISSVITSDSTTLIRRGQTELYATTSLDDFTNGPFKGVFYFNLKWDGGTCDSGAVATMKMTLTLDGSQVGTMEGNCIATSSSLANEVPAADDYILDVVGYTADGTVWGCLTMENVKVGAGVTNPPLEIDVPKDATSCQQ